MASQYKTFVAIVGADGAGKTTVASALVKELVRRGLTARYLDRWDIVGNPDYPAAGFLEKNVPRIRQCVADMPTPARFLFLLWSMSLAVTAAPEQTAHHEIVVMDGYWMKHAASEAAYGLEPEWVLAVSSAVPPPQVVLYLDLSPEEAWMRKQGNLVPYECGLDPLCSRSEFLRHQGRIRQLLHQWCSRFAWTRVDAAEPLAAVVRMGIAAILSKPSLHATHTDAVV